MNLYCKECNKELVYLNGALLINKQAFKVNKRITELEFFCNGCKKTQEELGEKMPLFHLFLFFERAYTIIDIAKKETEHNIYQWDKDAIETLESLLPTLEKFRYGKGFSMSYIESFWLFRDSSSDEKYAFESGLGRTINFLFTENLTRIITNRNFLHVFQQVAIKEMQHERIEKNSWVSHSKNERLNPKKSWKSNIRSRCSVKEQIILDEFHQWFQQMGIEAESDDKDYDVLLNVCFSLYKQVENDEITFEWALDFVQGYAVSYLQQGKDIYVDQEYVKRRQKNELSEKISNQY